MGRRGIITGQKIDLKKLELAKQMRKEMTPEERIMWEQLRANRLDGYHFRRQQVINGYIVDFYCHGAGLVVEIDGGIHKIQKAYDEERDLALSEIGLRVLRFTNDDVNKNLAAILVQISTSCRMLQNS